VPYLRCFGPTVFRSPDIFRSGEQSALGKDVIDLLDALRIEKATLVGYDLGGRAACVASGTLAGARNCSTTPGPRSPGIKNWDASLLKNFFVTEHDCFQFRAEFFNLFNTPQFLGPNSVFGTPSFGQISALQVNPARQIQFALKFYF
jgi:pimeloyl-ACP methyl ester carboxylesterase